MDTPVSAPVVPPGDCCWVEAWNDWSADDPLVDHSRPNHRRRRGAGWQRERWQQPSQSPSPSARSSHRRARRENERQRSLHMACTLLSVTGLTPGCGTDAHLTQYQRLSQLVRYTAFLEDATSALVKELGVRLNFDFSPVTRYIRRLRYQAQHGAAAVEFDADEADELRKLLETMSAGEPIASSCQPAPAAAPPSWRHRSAPVPAPAAARAPPAARLPDIL